MSTQLGTRFLRGRRNGLTIAPSAIPEEEFPPTGQGSRLVALQELGGYSNGITRPSIRGNLLTRKRRGWQRPSPLRRYL